MEEIEKENEQLTVENNKHKSEINELTKSLKSLTTNQQELMQKVCMQSCRHCRNRPDASIVCVCLPPGLLKTIHVK